MSDPATQTSLETNPHLFTRQQLVYVWLSGVYVTALLMANVLAVKLFRFETTWWPINDGGLEHTVGMLAFPITFLLTDLLNEYYGKKAARRVAYIAFAMGAIAWILIYAARKLPVLEGIPGTATQEAFDMVFASASLMYLASLVAFIFGALFDIYLFGVFKRLTGGRLVWLRATGSTVFSQFFDSLIVGMLFFYVFQLLQNNDPSFLFALKLCLTGYLLKFIIAVVLTPGIYLGRWSLQKHFGLTPIRLVDAA